MVLRPFLRMCRFMLLLLLSTQPTASLIGAPLRHSGTTSRSGTAQFLLPSPALSKELMAMRPLVSFAPPIMMERAFPAPTQRRETRSPVLLPDPLAYERAFQHNLPDRYSPRVRYSTRDWWHVLKSTPESEVLHRIRQPVFMTMVWSGLVAALYSLVPALPALSFKPHSLVGSALSLLLVFRTNAAYTRFWEGRSRWQQINDHVRSLSRLLMLYEAQLGSARRSRVARLLCSFPQVLKQHLRGYSSLAPEVERLLSEKEAATLRASHNQPLHVANLIGQQLVTVRDQWEGGMQVFSSRERLEMIGLVSKLSDCIGACERIVQTPVPLHYARHTSRLATIFVATLPLVLVRELGLTLMPVMAFICWALFGIQEIGLLIEDPFRGVLKLDTICESIERDVQQTLESAACKPEEPRQLFDETSEATAEDLPRHQAEDLATRSPGFAKDLMRLRAEEESEAAAGFSC